MQLKQATVLLVEDEPVLREIKAAWLGRAVGRVVCAEDGRGAAKILAADNIDLIISDIRMPVMDGIKLLELINQRPASRPAMIFITGFSDLSLREAYDMGADAILEKPIRREELLEITKTSLATVEELWQRPPGATPLTQLKMSFSSLPAALEENQIDFGRRGFCIKLPHAMREGPLQFAIEFRDEGIVVSGHGAVRWMAPEENVAGIEITSLDQPGRNFVMAHLKRTEPLAFIPSSPGLEQGLQSKVA